MFLPSLSFLRAGHHTEHANEEHYINHDGDEEHNCACHCGGTEVCFKTAETSLSDWAFINIVEEPESSCFTNTLTIKFFFKDLENSVKVGIELLLAG